MYPQNQNIRINRIFGLKLCLTLMFILMVASVVQTPAQELNQSVSPFAQGSVTLQNEAPVPLELMQTSPLLEHAGDSLTGSQDLLIAPEFSKDPVKRHLVPPPQPSSKEISNGIESLSSATSLFQVPLGQGRILNLKSEITEGQSSPLVAIGNPSVIDVTIVSPKQLRITGLRVGITDLSITSAKGDNFHFEVQVLADLTILQKKIQTTFPDASVHLSQIQNHVVVEGEARSQMQVANIIGLVSAYLDTITAAQRLTIQSRGSVNVGDRNSLGLGTEDPRESTIRPAPQPDANQPNSDDLQNDEMGGTSVQSSAQNLRISGTIPNPSIVNLLRVPTSQQVLLKVRVAELNRTALRNIGANFLAVDQSTGAIFGTQIAGPVSASGTAVNNLVGTATLPTSNLGARGGTTVYGIFQNANFEMPLNALRRNGLLKILAEPNLVALSGQQSSFLVGGEYPVPVPQVSASGVAPTVTVRFKEFGVRLGFVPQVLDQENLRLTVAPEVSEIDFTIAVTLVAGGSPVPGLNVRRSYTTVEMKHSQTLAIAGLLYLKLDGTTDRIPGLGDMPILGPFFSNTSSERVEKELVILVTPYIVEPMEEAEIPSQPGSEVGEPTDWEFYFMNRIESRKGVDFRSTTAWDNAQEHLYMMKMQKKVLKGQIGFSE